MTLQKLMLASMILDAEFIALAPDRSTCRRGRRRLSRGGDSPARSWNCRLPSGSGRSSPRSRRGTSRYSRAGLSPFRSRPNEMVRAQSRRQAAGGSSRRPQERRGDREQGIQSKGKGGTLRLAQARRQADLAAIHGPRGFLGRLQPRHPAGLPPDDPERCTRSRSPRFSPTGMLAPLLSDEGVMLQTRYE